MDNFQNFIAYQHARLAKIKDGTFEDIAREKMAILSYSYADWCKDYAPEVPEQDRAGNSGLTAQLLRDKIGKTLVSTIINEHRVFETALHRNKTWKFLYAATPFEALKNHEAFIKEAAA